MLGRIVESVHDLLSVVLFVKGADRTGNYTLTAVYTACGGEICLKGTADNRVVASVLRADCTDVLNLVAGAYTAAAKNTLVGVAHDGGAGAFHIELILADGGKVILLHAEVMSELLKLAGLGTDTGKALFLMSRKHKLYVHLSCRFYLFGIGQNFRAVALDGVNAGGNETSCAHYLNETKAAGAYLVYILKIAKRGNFYAGGSACLKHGGAVGHGIISAVYLDIKHFGFHLCTCSFLIS